MSAECVATVPLAWPHGGTALVTVTVAAPLLVASSVLVAVIVNEPAAVDVKDAVRPLGVSVPPAGVAFHVTARVQEEVALTVAVSEVAAPVFIVVGLATTVTPVTVQAGGLGVLAVLPLPHPESKSTVTVPAPKHTNIRRRHADGMRWTRFSTDTRFLPLHSDRTTTT
jgi:hypothetical protein